MIADKQSCKHEWDWEWEHRAKAKRKMHTMGIRLFVRDSAASELCAERYCIYERLPHSITTRRTGYEKLPHFNTRKITVSLATTRSCPILVMRTWERYFTFPKTTRITIYFGGVLCTRTSSRKFQFHVLFHFLNFKTKQIHADFNVRFKVKSYCDSRLLVHIRISFCI